MQYKMLCPTEQKIKRATLEMNVYWEHLIYNTDF